MNFFGGKVETDDGTPIDEIDEAMAPIEEIDSSSGDEMGMEREDKPYHVPGFPTPVDTMAMEEFRADVEGDYGGEEPASSPALLRDDSLSARQLRICLLALCGGLHQASTDFKTQVIIIVRGTFPVQ